MKNIKLAGRYKFDDKDKAIGRYDKLFEIEESEGKGRFMVIMEDATGNDDEKLLREECEKDIKAIKDAAQGKNKLDDLLVENKPTIIKKGKDIWGVTLFNTYSDDYYNQEVANAFCVRILKKLGYKEI